MMLLEHQHRPQSDRRLSAATNVDSNLLTLLQNRVSLRAVPRDKRALALSTQIRKLAGVLLGQALEAGIQIFACGSGVFDQVQSLNLVDDSPEDDRTGRVAHPGIELAVWLVWSQGGVAVVVSGSLRLLGKGHDVGRGGQVPVLVSPELAGRANAGLHLVDDQEDVGPLGDLTETLEERRGGVVVTTLRLNRLDDHGCDRVVELLDQALDFLQAALLLLGVFSGELVERVLEGGEGGARPVKGGNIEFVDGLAAGRGQTAKETAVEGRLEGHDGVVGGSGRLVHHGGRELLLRELGLGAATTLLGMVHERSLVCCLVGVGAGGRGEDLVQALGRHLEQAGLEDAGPVVGGEVAQGRPVDQRGGHLGGLCGLEKGWVVVSKGDGCDLGVHVEQDVTIEISNALIRSLAYSFSAV